MTKVTKLHFSISLALDFTGEDVAYIIDHTSTIIITELQQAHT